MAGPPTLDIGALYQRHADALLTYFARRTFDAELASDLLAETFARALESRARFRGSGEDSEAAWLYKIANRQLSRYYRRGAASRRAQTRLQMERPEFTKDAGVELMRRVGIAELRAELARALAGLSESTRIAVQLRVVEELSFSEVASRLDTSEQNARARVSRGLRALGEMLDSPATEVA